MKKDWYTVKGLYRWYLKEDGSTFQVEERIVLFHAESFDHALDLAEAEALTYCEPDDQANFAIESMGWWRAYSIWDEKLENGVEIFSRRSTTELSADAFIKRYYPKSHTRKIY
ncbi:DUF4288 domain-containing protein [Acinetobacter sp. ANC 5502]